MKILNVLLVIVLFSFALQSQSEYMPVILVETDVKANFVHSRKMKVVPGSILDKAGTLQLSSQGKAIIYHNYEFVEIDQQMNTMALDNYFGKSDELVSKSELNFGEKMSDAVYHALTSGVRMKNQKSLVSGWGDKSGSGKDGRVDMSGSLKDGWGDKSGSGKDGWGDKSGSGKDGWGDKSGSGKDGWGDKSGSGKDGWGDKSGSGKDGWGDKSGSGKDGWGSNDIKIRSLCPGGKYLDDRNEVTWEALKGTRNYIFVIEDMNHNIVFSRPVKGTRYHIEKQSMGLKNDTRYAWYVHHPTKKEVSTPVFFTISQKDVGNKVLSGINQSDIYQKANPDTRLLMEAHQWEESGYLLEAQTKYKEAIRMSPKNSLAKMMYSLFCYNLNELQSAVEALK
jgi:hypothetical protein